MTLKITPKNLWKILIINSSETKHTDLIKCSYAWLGQLNICAKYGILSDKKYSFYWIKWNGCYNIIVTFLSSQKFGDFGNFGPKSPN